MNLLKQILMSLACMVWLGSIGALAQSGECDNALVEANRLYKAGRMEASIDMLSTCSEELQSKAERAEKYRLLGLCYQAIGATEELEFTTEKLLKLNPEYKTYSISHDPTKFSKYLEQFTVTPARYFGMYTGISRIQPVIQTNNNPHYGSTVNYRSTAGYQIGLQMQQEIKSAFSLTAQVSAEGGTIQKEMRDITDYNQDYLESYDFINLRVLPTYRLGSSPMALMAGLELGGLMRTHSVVSNTLKDNNWVRQWSHNNIKERNGFSFGASLGVGYEKNVGPGTAIFSLHQSLPMNTFVKRNGKGNDITFAIESQHMNDVLKLSRTTLQVAFMVPVGYQISKAQD